jgi:cell filamentation protein
LATDGFLRGLARPEFVTKIAYYYAEINEIHPFREGNGRAQRAFVRQLTSDAGYRIDWTLVEADEIVSASVAAHVGDLAPMQQLFDAATQKI